MRLGIATAFAAVLFAGAASAGTITKSPDLGPFWNPLDSDNGTYVYANSFVADETGAVTNLGMWLESLGGDVTNEMRFQVLDSVGDNPANGPDTGAVLAATAILSLDLTGTLTFYDAAALFSATLTAGETYWFAANVVGLDAPTSMRVGGHTQNSEGITDNGTFWFSNDPNGVNFDGQRLTPEMAFRVVIGEGEPSGDVPAPGTLLLLGTAMLGLAARRRRTA